MRRSDHLLCGWARSATATATVLALLIPLLALPAMAQETAVFTGTIFDPSGAAAGTGYKVVLKDVSSGAQYTATTDASGVYHIPVPVGGRYKLSGVSAPDGTNLPVQNVPPISAMVPGTQRLDVKFTQGAVAPTTAGAAGTATVVASKPASTPPPEKEKKKSESSGKPWYKKPGPIVGIVLGAAAIAAIAIGSSGGCNDASPSQPGCQ